MMYDKGKILTGLFIFLALVLFPTIYGKGDTVAKPVPELDTPVIAQLTEKECVESKEYMSTNHMQLLNEWRDLVLREGQTTYVNSEGEQFEISLQNTCLNCHSNKENFCDSCHNYVAVEPYCWDCHTDGKEANP